MKLLLADTGPLYALVDISDSHHGRARNELERLSLEGWQLAALWPNLLETHTLLQRRLGLATAQEWLREAQEGLALLNPGQQHYAEACLRLAALPDQAITIVDAVLAVVAQDVRALVWTYDHDLDILKAPVWRT